MYKAQRVFTDPDARQEISSGSLGGKIFAGALIGSIVPGVGTVTGGLIGAATWGAGSSLNILKQGINRLESLTKPDTASPLTDTRASFTMRQASLDAMHNSAFNARTVIGNEASRMHR